MRSPLKSFAGFFLLALAVLGHVRAEEGIETDTNWKPLVILTFPMDNKSETTWGHASVKYTVFPSGFTMIENDVFGQSPGNSIHSAWLSEGRLDDVTTLVGSITASRATTNHPVDSIVMEGSATGNKRISRAIRPNIEDIESMLRKIDGLWPDLEPPLPKLAAYHK
jgi:hypothetical protein